MERATIFEAKRNTDNGKNCTFISQKLFDIDSSDEEDIVGEALDFDHPLEDVACLCVMERAKHKAVFKRKGELLEQQR